MNDYRTKNLPRMSEGLIDRSSRNVHLRDAAILRIHQDDADHLLVKLFHIQICLVNSLRSIQLNRQSMFGVRNI